MKVDSSKAVMLPVKSLTIWRSVQKQCLRMNSNLELVNRTVKGFQGAAKKSADGMSRSMDSLYQALLGINETLLEGFRHVPPKVEVSKSLTMMQGQQAGQGQQLALRALNTSRPVVTGKWEDEAATKVEWWKGLKEKKKEKDEKKPEEKTAETKIDPPKPKINLKKDPGPVPPTPPPSADSKILKFLKTADAVAPFNAIKSFGEKAVKEAAKPGDIADWNKMNENIDSTLGKIGEKAMGALRPVMDTINQALVSVQLAPIIDAMANGFLFIANVISMMVDGLLWLVGVIQDNWSYIKPILEAIAIVYLAAMIVQVYMLAAAWLIANWPILIIIAAIAALILIFQLLGLSAADVVGAIVGAFGYMMALIQNIGIGIRNIFVLVGDYIVNTFNNAVNRVQEFMYNLAMGTLNILYNMAVGAENFAGGFMKIMAKAINWVLDKFNSMIDALAQIPFFDKLGIGRIKVDMKEPEIPHAASDKLDMYRKSMESRKPETNNTPKRQTEMWEMVDFKDSYNSYKQKGEAFVDKFSDKGREAGPGNKKWDTFANGNMMHTSGTSLNANQGANLNNVNRVNEVGSINDTVDISSDDLKMLRELAELQAIQNFVELTPTVQVTTGNINNAGDIDSIITKIGQVLQEEFVSTAQGVYT